MGLMDHLLGHAAEGTTLLVTREIRWFHRCAVPAEVLDWFTTVPGAYEFEMRTDHYDLAAAGNGAGVKYRHGTYMDSKFRLSVRHDVALPGPFGGKVEDWVKISTPITPDTPPPPLEFVRVDKQLHTKSFILDHIGFEGERAVAGCEVEIASITSPNGTAWSLCFESFGPPELRRDAFLAGFAGLTATPIPDDIVLTSDQNYGYPDWIARLAIAA